MALTATEFASMPFEIDECGRVRHALARLRLVKHRTRTTTLADELARIWEEVETMRRATMAHHLFVDPFTRISGD